MIISLILGASLASIIGGRENEIGKFPGIDSVMLSYDSSYSIINRDNDRPPNHSLFIKIGKLGETRLLYNYDRHVEVVLSKGDNFIAISDFGGSDFSKCIILDANKPGYNMDVSAEFENKVGSVDSIFRNDHIYFRGIKWINKNRLRIEIEGYGSPSKERHVKLYDYEVGEGFKSVKSRARNCKVFK